MAGVSQLGTPYQTSQLPKTVQEVSMEDEELSERCGQEARSSVASLISMIQPEGQGQDENKAKLEDLKNRAQKVKNLKK